MLAPHYPSTSEFQLVSFLCFGGGRLERHSGWHVLTSVPVRSKAVSAAVSACSHGLETPCSAASDAV